MTEPAADTATRAVELDVFACPLGGIRLIEASAGTGKTWALCGLYMRLLLERRLEVQRILVVTFTNAATAELRVRIRDRIAETLAHLRGRAAASGDPFVPRLVEQLRSFGGLADGEPAALLEQALATFDEAAIFTIHGFCQRALADTPFAAQMPLAVELLQDDGELVLEAASDFWRRRLAGDSLDPALAALIDARHDSPQKFARLLRRHGAKPTASSLWPAGIDAPAAVDTAALVAAHDAARAMWLASRQQIVECVVGARSALHANIYRAESVQTAASGWDSVLGVGDALAALDQTADKIDLFGESRLRRATKKGQTGPQHDFFGVAQTLLDAREAALVGVSLARLRLLRDLQDEASPALREAKRQRRVVAFDDLLFNLHQRLSGADAQSLAAALRERFPAALIDEFQDTDPLQFEIFASVYRGAAGPLFLVGDPKQAIYSFRNADLHTYLRARSQADAETTLVDNQRSTLPLINALNGLFGANAQAFMLPGLAYRAVAFGAKPRPALVDPTQPRAALQVWMLPDDPASGQPMTKRDARQAAVQACAGEIARLLAAAQRGEITMDGRPLRAGDIAVLVRSHADGSLVRQGLGSLGVGSVELLQASVLHSADAEALERLLAAVLDPARAPLLKAALATEAIGLDASAIEALVADEPQWLATMLRFAGYRDLWLQRGIGFMLRQWLADERVAARLLPRADGARRLTNLLHLAELLHQAAESHPAPDALLRWLQAQRDDERTDEATQLRLESDRNLVQIVTIHKAKGLEYPLVFCPLLFNGRAGGFPDGLDGIEYHDDDGRAVIDFRKGLDDEFDDAGVKARVRLEQAAEAMRLVYVALTRAVHRCVIVAGCYLASSGRGASVTESTRSLLNWLVAGDSCSPAQWFEGRLSASDIAAAWHRWAARHAPDVALAPLPLQAGSPLPEAPSAPGQFAALPAPPPLAAGWWIGSYSALVHGAMHEQAAADHDLRVAPSNAPPVMPDADDDDILGFPRGAAAGECLHSVFERIDFTDPAGWPAAIATALDALRPETAASGGGDAAARSLHSRMLQRMLRDVLDTPLPVGTRRPLLLRDLPRSRRSSEMEFHLPVHRLTPAALNEALAGLGYAVPQLGFATLRGFLKGFIDLVLEHDGRYFIVDWKSNHLGAQPADYAPPALAAAMAAQGYQLQSLLYGVALDRHLRRRLGDYRPQRHFGGALYLFIRGLRPQWRNADGTPTGLHFHRAGDEAIAQLSALFDAGEVSA